jgi:hypothetical protein
LIPNKPIIFTKKTKNEFIHEVEAANNQIIDCFFSFFVYKNRLMSAHFRHSLIDEGRMKLNKNITCQIILSSWKQTKEEIVQLNEQFLWNGCDPRVIADKNNFYILFRAMEADNEKAYIFSSINKRVIPLKFNQENIPFGKNWVPFLKDGELFSIHGLDPFVILKIDTKTGIAKDIYYKNINFSSKANYDKYSIFRGGTNAIVYKKRLYGFGHATLARYKHYPFLWEFKFDSESLRITFQNELFAKDSFNIIDPTSLFVSKNKIYIGACYSERDWYHDQHFMNLLIEIDLNNNSTDHILSNLQDIHKYRYKSKNNKEIQFYSATDFISNKKFSTSHYDARTFNIEFDFIFNLIKKNIKSLLNLLSHTFSRITYSDSTVATIKHIFTESGLYNFVFRYKSSFSEAENIGTLNIINIWTSKSIFSLNLNGTGGSKKRILFDVNINLKQGNTYWISIQTRSKNFTFYDMQILKTPM